MGWFNLRSDREKLTKNLQEEEYYAQAALEVANNNLNPGLLAKAYAMSEGDEQRTRATYIGLRVEQLRLSVGAAAEAAALTKAEPNQIEARPPGPDKWIRVCLKCGSQQLYFNAVSCYACRGTNLTNQCLHCGSTNVARLSLMDSHMTCRDCDHNLWF